MRRIVQVVRIEAKPEDIFEALTRTDKLSQWWTRRVSGDGGAGGSLEFGFVEQFNPVMEVTEAERPQRVVWRCIAGAPYWKDDTISYELRPDGDATSLKFVQQYAGEVDEEMFGYFNHNWGYYLNSLRLLCEQGTGTPFEGG